MIPTTKGIKGRLLLLPTPRPAYPLRVTRLSAPSSSLQWTPSPPPSPSPPNPRKSSSPLSTTTPAAAPAAAVSSARRTHPSRSSTTTRVLDRAAAASLLELVGTAHSSHYIGTGIYD